jgi:hypothetical protein
VIQSVLHALLYSLEYMHKLTPHIEEDMEFQKGLNVKQFLEIFKSGKSGNI